uniref:Uncharacterized protein n=1 Tax=Plectus sambesii TaxID=2011161 RepID=A0A914XAB2_9BILA
MDALSSIIDNRHRPLPQFIPVHRPVPSDALSRIHAVAKRSTQLLLQLSALNRLEVAGSSVSSIQITLRKERRCQDG